MSCWIAPRDIEPGENYTQAILDGLEAAPVIVLMFSAATNQSAHVIRELETAVGSGRRIVPVRLEDAVEPSRSLRYFIGTSQWLEAGRGPEESWAPALVQAVRRAVSEAFAGAPVPGPGDHAVPVPAPAPSVPAGRRGALVGAGLVAAVILGVGVTLSLTRGDGADDGAGNPTSGDPGVAAAAVSGAADATESAGSAESADGPAGRPAGTTAPRTTRRTAPCPRDAPGWPRSSPG